MNHVEVVNMLTSYITIYNKHLLYACKWVRRSRFETRRDESFLSIYLILPAALGPRVYSTSKINEYQKQKNNVSGE
jgi:hypothetical protein